MKPPAGVGDSRGDSNRPEEEWWNEVSIVHYPSIRHFCDMLAGDDYQAINEKYRLAVCIFTWGNDVYGENQWQGEC